MCLESPSSYDPPSWATTHDSGSPLLARSPSGPVRSAREPLSESQPCFQKRQTLSSFLSTAALALPLPPEAVLALVGGGVVSADLRGNIPPQKKNFPSPRSISRGLFCTPTALRRLPSCRLRGTAPCPKPFRGSFVLCLRHSMVTRGHRLPVRHVREAARKATRTSIFHYLHTSLQQVLVCADRDDTNHRHPAFVCDADISKPSRSEIILGRRAVTLWRGRHGLSGVGHGADISAIALAGGRQRL